MDVISPISGTEEPIRSGGADTDKFAFLIWAHPGAGGIVVIGNQLDPVAHHRADAAFQSHSVTAIDQVRFRGHFASCTCLANTHSHQVQIEETRADRFLGGQLTQNHIWVRGDIRAGRTPDQRTNLMLNIVRDISLIAGVVQDNIWVYVCNLLPTHMVEYGHVLPAPGEERQWFDNLPTRLREYLKSLGTTETR